MNLAAKTLAISLSLAAGLAAQSNYGTACVGSNGKSAYLSYPANSWVSIPSIGETVTLVDGVAGAPVILWFGRNPTDAVNVDLTPIGMPGCFQLVNPMWTRAAVAVGSVIGMDESAEFQLPAAPPGQEFAFQALFLDTVQGRAIPISTSNGLIAKTPDSQPTFRVNAVRLADPHVFTFQFIACLDGTSTLNGFAGSYMNSDNDADMILDASLMFTFRPLTNTGSGVIDFTLPDCTIPNPTTICTIPGVPELRVDFNNSATCMGVLQNTTNWPVNTPTPGASNTCFTSDPVDLNFPIRGMVVPVEEAQISGTVDLSVSPATITGGLVRGFVSETVANSISVPADIPLIGGLSIASLLPGGQGNCQPGDARDTGPDGQTMGWWIYLEYDAVAVDVQ